VKRIGFWVFAISLASLIGQAVAGSYPERPIRVVVPFAAGGQTDSFARIVGESLQRRLGQPIVVDNRAGAGGVIGTDAVAKAEPDGYTIVVAGPSTIVTQPLLNSSVRYDVRKDFVPIAMVSAAPMLLVVNAKSPYHTLADLVAASKKKDLSYGSSGAGSSMHLGTEWLLKLTGMKAVHVPFRGSSQSLPSLLAGDIDFLIDPPITAYPLVESGQLRALGITTRTTDARLATIPTLAESGASGFDQLIWNGFMAPAGTPSDIVDKLASQLREIVADPEVAKQLDSAGVPAFYMDSKRFAQFLDTEREKYGKIIAEAHIQIEK
jgi:tripartite-type tricarboxylate transporter receptor subunit TctC